MASLPVSGEISKLQINKEESHILKQFTIKINGNNHIVSVIILSFAETLLHQKNTFNGEKIKHPFKRDIINNKHVYTPEFVDEATAEDAKTGKFTYKHDGGCGWIKYTEETDTHEPWTRFDVKGSCVDGKFIRGKHKWDNKTKSQKWIPNNDPIPENWIACSAEPTDLEATHWAHWRPCEKNDKHLMVAFGRLVESGMLQGITQSFTCEWMGKKINGKKADWIDESVVVPHGSVVFDIPDELRTPEGIEALFKTMAAEGLPMEGVIISGKEKRYKIRTELYSNEDGSVYKWEDSEGFTIKDCNRTGLSDFVSLAKHDPCGCEFHKEK
jgi:hypothetical protein